MQVTVAMTITFTLFVIFLKDGNMKRLSNPVIPSNTHYLGKKKVEEVTLTFLPCMICGKQIVQGYYGRWETGGTCSKKCEREKEPV